MPLIQTHKHAAYKNLPFSCHGERKWQVVLSVSHLAEPILLISHRRKFKMSLLKTNYLVILVISVSLDSVSLFFSLWSRYTNNYLLHITFQFINIYSWVSWISERHKNIDLWLAFCNDRQLLMKCFFSS